MDSYFEAVKLENQLSTHEQNQTDVLTVNIIIS